MNNSLGFIGVGVMGEPICRHLARSSGCKVFANDIDQEPLWRLEEYGVTVLESLPLMAQKCGLIFLSLPGGRELKSVCLGEDGLIGHVQPGQTIVDLSTSPVAMTREIAGRFETKGIAFADAPVARTRAAAEAGRLSVMVGCKQALFDELRKYFACFAEEIIHCGGVGCGQVTKLMNNMVLFQTVVALSEALCVARRAGMDGERLFEALSKSSADSFALRHHGMQSLLPEEFPTRAFSTDYARKDLAYALDLAAEVGLQLTGAEAAKQLLVKAGKRGFAASYFPSLIKVIEGSEEVSP